MKTLIIEDAREYIFPIFSVPTKDNGIFLEQRIYLGTAFFVTKHGDAITAGHVLPKPEELKKEHRLIALVVQNGKQTPCWITHCAKFELFDVALLHVNLEITKYLQVSADEVPGGTDVSTVGIPAHEVWGSGMEMRIFKGHVTFLHKFLELSFPVPLGMSGSPLLVGIKAVGYLTGTVRSEEIEESSEEFEEISDRKEVIRLTQIKRAIYYGLAYPFSHLKDIPDPALDGKNLVEFIADRNIQP
jgi:hypothetical protein